MLHLLLHTGSKRASRDDPRGSSNLLGMVRREGLEPSTHGLKVRYSAIELPAQITSIVPVYQVTGLSRVARQTCPPKLHLQMRNSFEQFPVTFVRAFNYVEKIVVDQVVQSPPEFRCLLYSTRINSPFACSTTMPVLVLFNSSTTRTQGSNVASVAPRHSAVGLHRAT